MFEQHGPQGRGAMAIGVQVTGVLVKVAGRLVGGRGSAAQGAADVGAGPRAKRDRATAHPPGPALGGPSLDRCRPHSPGAGGEALRVWREAMQTLGITSPSQFTEIQGLIEERPLAAL